jgi:hypothetical protein
MNLAIEKYILFIFGYCINDLIFWSCSHVFKADHSRAVLGAIQISRFHYDQNLEKIYICSINIRKNMLHVLMEYARSIKMTHKSVCVLAGIRILLIWISLCRVLACVFTNCPFKLVNTTLPRHAVCSNKIWNRSLIINLGLPLCSLHYVL